MGEAYGPVAEGPEAIYWNPAGLAQLDTGSANAFFDSVFAGKESPEYRQAMPPLAVKTGAFGLALYAVSRFWR